MNLGIGTWPARRVTVRPDATAVVFEGQSVTYRGFEVRARKLAGALRDSGVKHGDRVAHVGFNHPSLLETFFATGLLGTAAVLISPRLRRTGVRYVLRDCGATTVAYGRDQAENATAPEPELTEVRTWLNVDGGGPGQESEAFLQSGGEAAIDEQLDLDELALIIHRRFRAADVLCEFEESRVTSSFMVPAVLDSISHAEGFDIANSSSARAFMVGGSPLPERMLRTWAELDVAVMQGFGMTETAPGVRMLEPRDGVPKSGSAGRQRFRTEPRLVDPPGDPMAPGRAGEVIVRGPNMMAGRQIRKHLKNRLAGYKLPAVIEVATGLPRTTTGKVQNPCCASAHEFVSARGGELSKTPHYFIQIYF